MLTTVVSVSELLAGVGSVTVLEMMTELVKVPVALASTVTTMVRCKLLATPKLATVQVTILPAFAQPPVAEVKVTLVGKVSVMITFWAVAGPLLVNERVYVKILPAETGSGVSDFVIAKSADGC